MTCFFLNQLKVSKLGSSVFESVVDIPGQRMLCCRVLPTYLGTITNVLVHACSHANCG